ncbi:hypothetical protein F383_37694 [Gossypium arboreum]|uniref:Uncharacterized protein n=1 Tax=Gossypium arboreum TaxID=29729 RepID=A0A0B0MG52_GOSAR|nr:hypothetical protein F383_37694 [Gossypium arboreum]
MKFNVIKKCGIILEYEYMSFEL